MCEFAYLPHAQPKKNHAHALWLPLLVSHNKLFVQTSFALLLKMPLWLDMLYTSSNVSSYCRPIIWSSNKSRSLAMWTFCSLHAIAKIWTFDHKIFWPHQTSSFIIFTIGTRFVIIRLGFELSLLWITLSCPSPSTSIASCN